MAGWSNSGKETKGEKGGSLKEDHVRNFIRSNRTKGGWGGSFVKKPGLDLKKK